MARVFPLDEGALGNWAFYAQGSDGSTLPQMRASLHGTIAGQGGPKNQSIKIQKAHYISWLHFTP